MNLRRCSQSLQSRPGYQPFPGSLCGAALQNASNQTQKPSLFWLSFQNKNGADTRIRTWTLYQRIPTLLKQNEIIHALVQRVEKLEQNAPTKRNPFEVDILSGARTII